MMLRRRLPLASQYGSVRSVSRSLWSVRAAAWLLLVFSSPVIAQDQSLFESLPRLSEMVLPSADELLKADLDDTETDWVVLTASTVEERRVVVCNPIFPRPDTLKKLAEEYKVVEATKPSGDAEREERVKRLRELQRVLVTLPGNVVKEYGIPIGRVDHIVLFEDLMLRRVDELLNEGNIRKAYELLLRVENEVPGWEVAAPRFDRLLLVESGIRAAAGETYAALALLDEAAARNPGNPELRERLGAIVGPMIDEAVSSEDYTKVRYLVSRVQRVVPDHELVAGTDRRLTQLAAQIMFEAERKLQARQFPEAAMLAGKSAAISAPAGNAAAIYSQCIARYQVLRVGVTDLGDPPPGYPSPREADERLRELTEVPLFEPSSADELTYFRSGSFEAWDPADLGREIVFKLRETRPHWQSQALLTANEVADALGHRIDPGSPLFHPRLASFVSEISVRSPTELRLRFRRVPLSIESLLRFPATGWPAPAAEGEAVSAAAAGSNAPVVLSRRFQPVERTDSVQSYLRDRPEPEGLDPAQYHLAEIREQTFTSRDELLKAMIRGRLDYLPELLPWEVDAFKASTDFQTRQYAIPVSHVLVFNPLSDRITSAQMRRALSFAINREAILKSIILRDDAMTYGRPSSAAWHLSSYATNPRQRPPVFDLKLAYVLRFAAERQLQLAELTRLLAEAKSTARAKARADAEAARAAALAAASDPSTVPPLKVAPVEIDSKRFMKETKVDYIRLPRLRVVVDPDPTAIAAVERMLIYWQKVGFEVDLIRADQSTTPLTDADWDLCYRRVRMEEPLLELWPLITNDTTFNMNRLMFFPDWMRQELIGLDYASSFLDAQSRMYTIHSHIAAQAFLIPLWEVDQFAVWKKSVLGIPDRPISTYQNVERWIIRP